MKALKTKTMSVVVLFSILITFTGCSRKYNLLKQNPYENTTRITGNIKEIIITDLRQNISNREINIPIVTFPGMKDEISQSLQESTKTLIKDEITKQFSADSDISYIVEVKLIRGIIGFRAYALSEKEYTDIAIEILAIDQFNNKKIFNSTIYLEVKSSDASPYYVHLLFERALVNAIHRSFKDIER